MYVSIIILCQCDYIFVYYIFKYCRLGLQRMPVLSIQIFGVPMKARTEGNATEPIKACASFKIGDFSFQTQLAESLYTDVVISYRF